MTHQPLLLWGSLPVIEVRCYSECKAIPSRIASWYGTACFDILPNRGTMALHIKVRCRCRWRKKFASAPPSKGEVGVHTMRLHSFLWKKTWPLHYFLENTIGPCIANMYTNNLSPFPKRRTNHQFQFQLNPFNINPDNGTSGIDESFVEKIVSVQV